MKKIPLTRGLEALVDDSDFEQVNRFKWHAVKTAPGVFYAARTESAPGLTKRMILLHRFIMQPPEGLDIDHKDRNRLNCQRHNLRIATRGQNLAAKPFLLVWKGKKKTSRFRGVARAGKIWTAQISVKNRKKHLGCFEQEIDAARAYDDAARTLFGEFASPNFPNKQNQT